MTENLFIKLYSEEDVYEVATQERYKRAVPLKIVSVSSIVEIDSEERTTFQKGINNGKYLKVYLNKEDEIFKETYRVHYLIKEEDFNALMKDRLINGGR